MLIQSLSYLPLCSINLFPNSFHSFPSLMNISISKPLSPFLPITHILTPLSLPFPSPPLPTSPPLLPSPPLPITPVPLSLFPSLPTLSLPLLTALLVAGYPLGGRTCTCGGPSSLPWSQCPLWVYAQCLVLCAHWVVTECVHSEPRVLVWRLSRHVGVHDVVYLRIHVVEIRMSSITCLYIQKCQGSCACNERE